MSASGRVLSAAQRAAQAERKSIRAAAERRRIEQRLAAEGRGLGAELLRHLTPEGLKILAGLLEENAYTRRNAAALVIRAAAREDEIRADAAENVGRGAASR